MFLAVDAATRGLATPPPALGQGPEDDGPRQALELLAEHRGRDGFEVIQ